MPRTRKGKVPIVFIVILTACLFNWQNALHGKLSSALMGENTRELVIPNNIYNGEPESEREITSTTIIINTSFIKTHPSLLMFNATFDSLRHLHGLPPKTPVVITVDGLIPEGAHSYHYISNDSEENRESYQEYVRNLRLKFKKDKHVTILTNYNFGLLTVNLRMAMDFVDTKYVLVIQHDLKFLLDVDYTGLIQSMEDNPETLKIVRFASFKNMNYHDWSRIENEETKEYCTLPFHDEKNNMTFVPQVFSDQNHVTTKEYYLWLLDVLGPQRRFMETAMMYHSNPEKDPKSCRTNGQWLYGPLHSGPWIQHLDGKHSEGIAQ